VLLQRRCNLAQQLFRDLRSPELATAKDDHEFYLIAIFQKLDGVADLGFDVVRADGGAEANRFHIPAFLLLLGFLREFLLFVAVAPVVQNATHGRVRRRRDFDQIQSFILGDFEGATDMHHAQLLAVYIDDPHLFGADAVIDSQFLLNGSFPLAAYSIIA